jgi:tRNA A37 threonylcarbamoyltransferase TsaD
MKYKKIGQTRDDAVGEAFDKVAGIAGGAQGGGDNFRCVAGGRLHFEVRHCLDPLD